MKKQMWWTYLPKTHRFERICQTVKTCAKKVRGLYKNLWCWNLWRTRLQKNRPRKTLSTDWQIHSDRWIFFKGICRSFSVVHLSQQRWRRSLHFFPPFICRERSSLVFTHLQQCSGDSRQRKTMHFLRYIIVTLQIRILLNRCS